MPDRPTYRPVYKALHRPLTIWGVDRRLFFMALLLGAATFNLFYSFLAGLHGRRVVRVCPMGDSA
jgi:Type IV secretory pathway, VirB3-like protein